MKIQKKIDFINEVNEFFRDAKNHGRNGYDWRYPKENVIAYDVKMHSWSDIEDFRKHLTRLQNEQVSDESLSERFQDFIYREAESFIDELKEEFAIVDCWYAGRSGGWIEVEYNNYLQELEYTETQTLDIYGNDITESEVEDLYQDAKKLQALESKISEYIKKRHQSLNEYICSEEYYKDLKDELLEYEYIKSDADILRDRKLNKTLEELLKSTDETVKRHAQGIAKKLKV